MSPGEQQLYVKYIGALALLGRISRRSDLSTDDSFSISSAFADANQALADRKATIVFVPAAGGGYCAVERKTKG